MPDTNQLAYAGYSTTPPASTQDGLDFSGYPKPPSVPPDPSGDDWRGPPGPVGPPGPGAAPSDTVPLRLGTGAAGTAGTASRGDHVHPSDVLATGSTAPRALQDRFAEVINVKDFGAKGDGTTDDSAAIHAALAVGGSVYFPTGTYLVQSSSNFVIKSNTRMWGDGSGRSIIKINGTWQYSVFCNTLYNTLGPYTKVPTTPANQTDVNISVEGLGFDCSSYAYGGIFRFLLAHNLSFHDLRSDNGLSYTASSSYAQPLSFMGCDQVIIDSLVAINCLQAVDCWKGCTRFKLNNIFAESVTGGGNGGVFNYQGVGTSNSDQGHSSDLQATNITVKLHGGLAFFLDGFAGGSTTYDVLLQNVSIVAVDGAVNQAVMGRGLGGRITCRNFGLRGLPGATFQQPFLIGGYYSAMAAYTASGILTTTNGSNLVVANMGPNGTDIGTGNFLWVTGTGPGNSVSGNGLTLSGYYLVTAIGGTANDGAGVTGTTVTFDAKANATASGPIAASATVLGYLGSYNDCDLSGIVIDSALTAGMDVVSLGGSGHRVNGLTITQTYPVAYRSVVAVDGYIDFSAPQRASWVGGLVANPGIGSLQAGWIGDNTVSWSPYGPAPVQHAGALPLAGGTLSGALTLAADPAANLQPVTLQYYNAHLPAVPVASSTVPIMNGTAAVGTGTTWARTDHVHPSDTSRLPLTGGTLTGTLTAPTLTSNGDVNVANGSHLWLVPGVVGMNWSGATITVTHEIYVGNIALGASFGAWGTTPPASKPNVTGAKGSNAALASLLTALAAYGLVTDSTSA